MRKFLLLRGKIFITYGEKIYYLLRKFLLLIGKIFITIIFIFIILRTYTAAALYVEEQPSARWANGRLPRQSHLRGKFDKRKKVWYIYSFHSFPTFIIYQICEKIKFSPHTPLTTVAMQSAAGGVITWKRLAQGRPGVPGRILHKSGQSKTPAPKCRGVTILRVIRRGSPRISLRWCNPSQWIYREP